MRQFYPLFRSDNKDECYHIVIIKVFHFINLFIGTAHINYHFRMCANVSQLANIQLQSFGDVIALLAKLSV